MDGSSGRRPSSSDLRTSLIITTTVVLTVLVSIYLSLADSLQVQVQEPIRPTPQAVALSGTSEPPTVVLPSPTATDTAIPTETDAPVNTLTPTSSPLPTKAATTTATPEAEASASAKPEATSTPVPTTTPVPLPTATPRPVATATAMPTAVSMIAEVNCGNVPAGWAPYIIRPGDSLFRLSLDSGATINEIVQANCLDINVLYSGTQIFLPNTPPERTECGPPMSWERYTVQRGDTLFSLARSRSATVFDIMQANCLVSSRIFSGRLLFLPPISTETTATPSVAEPSPPVEEASPTPVLASWQITSPTSGATVSGMVPINGSVSFDPTIVQFYKIELGTSDPQNPQWVTLGEAGSTPVTGGSLGTLLAEAFPPGEYLLRLVVVKWDGNYAGPPHTVPIIIE